MRGLPRFEGNDVVGARLKINGLGEDLDEALKVGDRVYFCIEAEVYDVGHSKEKKGGAFMRTHKAAIIRTGLMDAREAAQLLEAEAERRAMERDQREGKQALPFPTGGRSGKDAASGTD